jgi:ankyrin repeat protein
MSLSHHCFRGNLLGVQQCLANGADVNKDGGIPLHDAVINGNLEIVCELLNAGAVIDIRDDDEGFTALHWAAMYGHSEIIRELIYRGLSVNIKNFHGKTALHSISYWEDGFESEDDHRNAKIAKELIEHGADINALDNDGETPLVLAVCYNGLELLRELLKHNASVNIKCKYGSTALHCASEHGLVEIAKELLPYSDLSIKDDDGHTALDIIYIELSHYNDPTDICQRDEREDRAEIIKLISDYEILQIKEPVSDNCD